MYIYYIKNRNYIKQESNSDISLVIYGLYFSHKILDIQRFQRYSRCP